MNGLRIHHYGLATDDLERSMETLGALGYRFGEITLDPVQKVRVVFAFRPGEAMIELICDIDQGGPTRRMISKVGNGLYHICYEVDDMEGTMAKLREKGFLLMHAPVPAPACAGKRIAWMYERYIGVVELLEHS